MSKQRQGSVVLGGVIGLVVQVGRKSKLVVMVVGVVFVELERGCL